MTQYVHFCVNHPAEKSNFFFSILYKGLFNCAVILPNDLLNRKIFETFVFVL
jgi:hypothetical protein